MTNYIWGSLNKAVNDPTLIDQAIETAVGAHNDDPDAHLGADQALQSHRAAEIIDHLAESVVNDKLAARARAYTAVVGSGNSGDFDVIEDAIEFVESRGGGNVLIAAGDFFVESTINLPAGVSLCGLGAGATVVHCVQTTGAAFDVTGAVDDFSAGISIMNISFVSPSLPVFSFENCVNFPRHSVELVACGFEGQFTYITGANSATLFRRCVFDCGASAAVIVVQSSFEFCSFVSNGAGVALEQATAATSGASVSLQSCDFDGVGSDFVSGAFSNCNVSNTSFSTIAGALPFCGVSCSYNIVENCSFTTAGTANGTINGEFLQLSNLKFTSTDTTGDGGIMIYDSNSSKCITINSQFYKGYNDNGSQNQFTNCLNVSGYVTPEPTGETFSTSNVRGSITTTNNTATGLIVSLGGSTTVDRGGNSSVLERYYVWSGSEWVFSAREGDDTTTSYTNQGVSLSNRLWRQRQNISRNTIRLTVFDQSGTNVVATDYNISGDIGGRSICDLSPDNTKFVVASANAGDGIRIGTISGTTVTMSAPVVLPPLVIENSAVNTFVNWAVFSRDGAQIFASCGSGVHFVVFNIVAGAAVFNRSYYVPNGFNAKNFVEVGNKTVMTTNYYANTRIALVLVGDSYVQQAAFSNSSAVDGYPENVGLLTTDGDIGIVTTTGKLQVARLTSSGFLVSTTKINASHNRANFQMSTSSQGWFNQANFETTCKILIGMSA